MTIIHCFFSDKKGSISVELALIASVVFLAIIPLTDFITRIYNGQQLASANRAAMQYVLNNPDDTSGAEDAAKTNAGSLDSDELSVSTTEFCECNGVVQACGDVCLYGEKTFLTVSATYNQGIVNYR